MKTCAVFGCGVSGTEHDPEWDLHFCPFHFAWWTRSPEPDIDLWARHRVAVLEES